MATAPTEVAHPSGTPLWRRASQSRTDAVLIGLVGLALALRLWDLGAADLSIDETYTVLAARLPLSDVIGHIDRTDPHGPVPYLLLRPIAGVTTDVMALRAVSAVASVAAVGLLAIWLRTRGLVAVAATGVLAVAPFQLAYGRQVRMYGLLALAGVAAAYCAYRWLEENRLRWAIGASAAGLVTALSHATGPVLLLALMTVPLLRIDTAANLYRACVAVASAAFGVTWGAHALRWSGGESWLPTSDPEWASVVVNELVAPVPSNRWLVLPVLVVGAGLLLLWRDALSRVWVCLFVIPLAVLYVVGLRDGVFVPRALMPYSWGVAIALGASCGEMARRSALVGAVAVILVSCMLLPFVGAALERDEGAGATMAEVAALRAPGDGVGHPDGVWQYESLVGWYEGVGKDRTLVRDVESVEGFTVAWPDGAERPRRAWIVGPAGERGTRPRLEPCSETIDLGAGHEVRCYRMPEVG